MEKINRRDFLKFIGAGGIGAGAGLLYGESTRKTVELLIPQVVTPEDYSPGIATWYNTVCRLCSAGCGISVRTREGRAKKIEGNPNHPVNQGRLCALGQAGLNALYNPDRIRTPLRRTGDRGNFAPIDWDEALTLLGRRLGNLKIKKQGSSVYLLAGGLRGHIDTLFYTFMQALGSDHYLHYEFTHPAALYAANRMIFNQDILPYYDISNASYVLSFGADYLGTWLSPVHYSLAYGHLRQGRTDQRGKCVQIEPRMSLTGASADEWIACRPGSEGLLAMAMVHVIVNDGLYRGPDRNAWLEATGPYTPEAVAAQADVAADVITRLAHEFIRRQPGLAIGGGSAASNTNATASLAAINVLNYLAGNLNTPGGVIFNPDPVSPASPVARQASYARLQEWIEAMAGGGVDVLITHAVNPVFTLPPAAGFTEALAKVAMVVSLSSFMDETTALADLILPSHTYLESWGDDMPEPGVGFPVATLSQPVVKPLYDTRDAGDIILSLAHQIGGELPVVLPWTRIEDYLKDSWKHIYGQRRITADSGGNFDEFWNAALAAGVWGENITREPLRFDGVAEDRIRALQVPPPAFAGEEKDHPFVLLPYLTQAFHDGRGANLPWLQELPDPLTSIVYGAWVEINPATAKRFGIREGDIVEVQTPSGSLRAPAFLYPAIRPDVIAMPIGQGHSQYGRYARGRGANPLEILSPLVDEASGALAWSATRAGIRKTGERAPLIKTDGVTRTLGRQILDDKPAHT